MSNWELGKKIEQCNCEACKYNRDRDLTIIDLHEELF